MNSVKSNRSGSLRGTALVLVIAMIICTLPCGAMEDDQARNPSRTFSWELIVPAWLDATWDRVVAVWQKDRGAVDPNGKDLVVPAGDLPAVQDMLLEIKGIGDRSTPY